MLPCFCGGNQRNGNVCLIANTWIQHTGQVAGEKGRKMGAEITEWRGKIAKLGNNNEGLTGVVRYAYCKAVQLHICNLGDSDSEKAWQEMRKIAR